ncbi:IS110 family transposase [Rhodococcus ruber BKS 20-38]|uniref:IS110 family transposase n=1 Tax=Rhodococcus ruber BKS 20-38 TaxID=1278076 RepID=M2ZIW6_9NOCA|nr:IS110 family transposase [Rhodococcus ruber BKS 20-38]
MGTRLAEEILTALDAQTVTVPGSNAAEIVLPKLADSLKNILQQRKIIADDIERCSTTTPFPRS